MTIGAKKERRDVVMTRILQIDAESAEHKRLWLNDGVETPLSIRVGLTAERANLNLELHRLRLEIHALEKAEKALGKAQFTAVLVRMLIERGHGEIVREAERASLDLTMAAR